MVFRIYMSGGERPVNVLLVVADELMAAALPAYGGSQVDTPALDRLAATGTTFDRAYCNSPVCTPSRYSMLSGRYAWSMHVYHNQSPTPSGYPSLAGRLSDRGYDTVGIGKMHFKGDDQMWGYASRPYGDFGGLSHQPDPLPTAPRLSYIADAGPADIDDADQHDVIVGRMGCEYLQARDPAEPFFLHLSFNFPHYPLRPPKRLFDRYYPARADLPRRRDRPEREHPWMRERRAVYRDLIRDGSFGDEQIRRARAAYYACIALVDEQLGRVLDVLDERGLAGNTLVLFAADHGEMLGEHGTWEKNCFYEQSARVPLIVRLPGQGLGRRVGDVVELVDIVPTVEALTGGSADGGDGESLLPLIDGRGRRVKDYAISELAPTYVQGVARMVRRGRWKYIAYDNASPSLFDLDADPDELDDLGLDGDVAMPELAELAATDFDRVQAESRSADRAVHPSYADMAPNQYRTADGSLADAEQFYECPSWTRPTRVAEPRITRVRPEAPTAP
jgi:choline-sulfatase